jgi:thiol-disulfide isomerase/thioredoxin
VVVSDFFQIKTGPTTMRPLWILALAAALFTPPLLHAGDKVKAVDLAASAGKTEAKPANPAVKLVKLNWNGYVAKVTKNPRAKYVLVDAWATNCAPCKENFPHLIQMHHKFAKQGLAVASLSLDDIEDHQALAEAEKFLQEKDAVITNVLLDEEFGVGFEKLDINAIPAVFLYSSDGVLLRRFTLDDVDNQFTYDDVEHAVSTLLKTGKLPPEKTATAAK